MNPRSYDDPAHQGAAQPGTPSQPGHTNPPNQPPYAPPAYGQPYGSPRYAPGYGQAYGPGAQTPSYSPQAYAQPGYPVQPGYPAVPPAPARHKRNVPLLIGGGVGAVILVCFIGLCAIAAMAGRMDIPRPAQRTPTPSERVVVRDALTTNTNGWAEDADCAFASDGYHIRSASICYYPRHDFGDANVSVTVRQTAGDTSSAYGIAVRRPSRGNYYAFEITGGGEWHFAKGSDTLIGDTTSAAIKLGAGVANTLTIRMRGQHFDLFVNGTKVGQADDADYASGKVGLTGDTRADVVYTDFRVTQSA